MSDIVKGIYSTFQEEINNIIRGVIYDTIPQGDVLKRAAASHELNSPKCNKFYDGCNTCTSGGRCTAMYCDEPEESHCIRYECEGREDTIHMTGKNTPIAPSNRVCGTYFNITKIGCTCKPEYQYRDKDSFKCVSSCNN